MIPRGVLYASSLPVLLAMWRLGLRTRGMRRLIILSLISLSAGLTMLSLLSSLPLRRLRGLEAASTWLGAWLINITWS